MKLMNVMEPITKDNIDDLRPGEWIWDNKRVRRATHYHQMNDFASDGAKSVCKDIYEPFGFRQIHILDTLGGIVTGTPVFKLSTNSSDRAYVWARFEENRYYKFKWNLLANLGQKKGE